MEPVKDKAIIGWRKLIFGLTSLICITGTELYVSAGWSKFGIAGVVSVTALFYGPPVLKELTNLVKAWRSKGE